MTNGLQLGAIYLMMAGMLVAGMLMGRRGRIGTILARAFGWTTVFAAGFLLFSFRDDLGMVTQRLRAEALGEPVRAGREMRVPMAADGHFWVTAMVNGEKVRFLVDTGATMTTIGGATAERVGVRASAKADQLVRTGNGVIRVARARAEQFEIGTIDRQGVAVHVTPIEQVNVLGMNFLSTLSRWSVEGRWLVMVS